MRIFKSILSTSLIVMGTYCANAQADYSQCSDVLDKHLLDRKFEFNQSGSEYLYAQQYYSMRWSEFQKQSAHEVSAVINGFSVGGSASEEKFKQWKEELGQSINISEIRKNIHSLMLSSANPRAFKAWENCMLINKNKEVVAILKSVSHEIYNLELYASPYAFGSQNPKVDAKIFLDNADIVSGGKYLIEGADIDVQAVITMRRQDSSKPIIFNMNVRHPSTTQLVSAYAVAEIPIPNWPPEPEILEYSLKYNGDFAVGSWVHIAPPPKEAFPITHITGEMSKGLIISGGEDGRSLWYIRDFASGTWHQIIRAPFVVKGLAGNNQKGPIIYGGNSLQSVAYLKNYGRQLWTTISVPVPVKIGGITGNNSTGPIIFGGAGNRAVYYLENYATPNWVKVTNTPFAVAYISGERSTGILIAGGIGRKHVAYMNNYSSGEWNLLPDPPVGLAALAGSIPKGPVAISDESSTFFFLRDYSNPVWEKRRLPSGKIAKVAGENSLGIIIAIDEN